MVALQGKGTFVSFPWIRKYPRNGAVQNQGVLYQATQPNSGLCVLPPTIPNPFPALPLLSHLPAPPTFWTAFSPSVPMPRLLSPLPGVLHHVADHWPPTSTILAPAHAGPTPCSAGANPCKHAYNQHTKPRIWL